MVCMWDYDVLSRIEHYLHPHWPRCLVDITSRTYGMRLIGFSKQNKHFLANLLSSPSSSMRVSEHAAGPFRAYQTVSKRLRLSNTAYSREFKISSAPGRIGSRTAISKSLSASWVKTEAALLAVAKEAAGRPQGRSPPLLTDQKLICNQKLISIHMVAIITCVRGLPPSVLSALSASVEEAMEAVQQSLFAQVRDFHRIRPLRIAHGDGQLEPCGSTPRLRCSRLRRKRWTGRSECHLRISLSKIRYVMLSNIDSHGSYNN